MHLKRVEKTTRFLKIVTPIATVISVVIVTVAMFTNDWLKTSEHIYFRSLAPSKNGEKEALPRIKETVSGLWTICITDNMINLTVSPSTHTYCFGIKYFGNETYSMDDGDDSTMAIPFTVTRSGPFFFIGYFLLTAGVFMSVTGYLWRRCRIVVFVSGVVSIIAGLVLFIGVVVYLSVLQAEVGQKLRPPNAMDRPPFIYTYGYGIILMAIGSIFTEITGTSVTLWYIHWHQLDWAQKKRIARGNGGSLENSEDNSTGSNTRGHAHVYCISGNSKTNVVGPTTSQDFPTHQYGCAFNTTDTGDRGKRLTPIIECPGSSKTHQGQSQGHGRRYRYSSAETDNFWELGSRGRDVTYDKGEGHPDNYNDNEPLDFEIPAPPPPPVLRDIPPGYVYSTLPAYREQIK